MSRVQQFVAKGFGEGCEEGLAGRNSVQAGGDGLKGSVGPIVARGGDIQGGAGLRLSTVLRCTHCIRFLGVSAALRLSVNHLQLLCASPGWLGLPRIKQYLKACTHLYPCPRFALPLLACTCD